MKKYAIRFRDFTIEEVERVLNDTNPKGWFYLKQPTDTHFFIATDDERAQNHLMCMGL